MSDSATTMHATGTRPSAPPLTATARSPLAAQSPVAVSAWTARQWTLVLVVVLAGVGLRVARYAAPLGFEHDEVLLIANVMDRGWDGAFRPLDYDQAAPVGFVLMEEACQTLRGTTERAMRLPPLLASIAALPLLAIFCRKFMTAGGTALAAALLALGEPMLIYTGRVKPY